MATVFRFFDMALELRNSVYRSLARQEPTNVSQPNSDNGEALWSAKVHSYAEPALLTVNKRFKAEYENEVYREANLDVTCLFGFKDYSYSPLVLPGNLSTNIRSMYFAIPLTEWKDTKALLLEKNKLLRVCQLPSLQKLRVEFQTVSTLVERWSGDATTLGESMVNKLFFSLIDNFSLLCGLMHEHADVDVGLYLLERLYDMVKVAPLFAEGDVYGVHLEEFRNNVRNLPGNVLTLRASRSHAKDQYSFYGLRLELDQCGHFDEQEYRALAASTTEKIKECLQEDLNTQGPEDTDFRIVSVGLGGLVIRNEREREEPDASSGEVVESSHNPD